MIHKRLFMALGVALCLATTLTSQANAQSNQQKAERARAAAAEASLKDATKLAAAYGIPCEITEAANQGDAQATIDGKTVNLTTFEVVCKEQRGYLLYRGPKSTPIGDPINCLQATAIAKASAGAPVCKLKANRTAHYWLGDIAKTKIPNCSISGARFLSLDPAAKTETYEIGCKNAPGGVFVVQTSGNDSSQAVSYHNCLKLADSSTKCELTTPELAAQTLSGLVRKNAAGCTISNARFIGATSDAEFYEIGCKEKAGFVLSTTTDGAYKSTIGCEQAATIGGCQFTDSTALAAENNTKQAEAKNKQQENYTKALAAANVACTLTDHRRIGFDKNSNRDLVELKCDEAPYGLLAFIPLSGATTRLESFDCFTAATQKTDCQYVPQEQLKAHLQKLVTGHKSINADCAISEARYAFDNNGQVVLEIACANKRGYIAVLNKARTALNPAVPCHIAATNANVPEKCTLAGNGTNKDS